MISIFLVLVSQKIGLVILKKKGAFSYDLIDKAINLFEGFFGASGDEGIILVALSFNDEREDDVDTIKKYGKLYEDVKDKGLVFPMNDDFESYLYGDSCLPASSLKLSFDANDFKDLSRLLMCHAGVITRSVFILIYQKMWLFILMMMLGSDVLLSILIRTQASLSLVIVRKIWILKFSLTKMMWCRRFKIRMS